MGTWNRTKKISLLMTAVLVLSGCGAEQTGAGQETASRIAVKAAEAELGTLAVSNQFIGTVSPQQQVSIVPMVSGEVDAVYAEVGDEVKAGDVLFHIKDDAAKLQKESAELSKQGAELSAQMQLGSAQVMNNISMQSNIRSLEYQLEMAKDQYASAVDGVADAQDAKEEMNKAIDEINRSVSSLQSSQKEMQDTIERAKDDCITLTGEWKVVYNYPLSPDHYVWGQEKPSESDDSNEATSEEAESTPATSAGFSNYEEGAGMTEDALPEESSEQESAQVPEAESGTDAESTDERTAAADKESDAAEAPDEKGTDEAETAAVNAAAEPAAQNTESADGDKETVRAENAGYAYFSVELIKEADVQYLAEAAGDSSYVPKSTVTEEEAWAYYNEQQEINRVKQKAEEMGFSAMDIKTLKADAAMLENSAKIAALQYQASQLQSSEATLESSIKSAESAKDTTSKTIDFYEDNLENAQITYGISNGQAYQDTAGALATQIQAADVGVRSAQMQLEYYSPTTPISGTVVSKSVEQYGLVQPGYAAYVISNQDAMNVTFSVSGQVRESLQIGMPVTLEKNGMTYTGTITEIGETVDPQSGGLFTVKAITEADGDKLASGTAVKLTVDTYRAENAVLIPYDAVHFESEQAYVFEIVDHVAVRTPITIGLMSDDMVQVTEGLTAGAQVVATWSSQLEDGAAVRIIGENTGVSDANADEEQPDETAQSSEDGED